MKKKFFDWVADQQHNLFLAGLITFGAPKMFMRAFYKHNQGSAVLWKGKDACLTISFDCDYPRDVEAVPFVLTLLKKYPFKTSFASVGHWIEKFPNEHKMVLDAGHEIMNHTYSHPDNELLNPGRKFKDISRQEKKEEIERCHDICKKVLGYEPKGCRIPHFKNLFTPQIYGILKELGYTYSSSTLAVSTKSFGMPFIAADGIYEFPLTSCPEHPFTVFDTWHSFNSTRWFYKIKHRGEEAYNDLFRQLIDLAIDTRSYINIYIDPYDLYAMKEFPRILEYITERKDKIWIATYQDIKEVLAGKGAAQ